MILFNESIMYVFGMYYIITDFGNNILEYVYDIV